MYPTNNKEVQVQYTFTHTYMHTYISTSFFLLGILCAVEPLYRQSLFEDKNKPGFYMKKISRNGSDGIS